MKISDVLLARTTRGKLLKKIAVMVKQQDGLKAKCYKRSLKFMIPRRLPRGHSVPACLTDLSKIFVLLFALLLVFPLSGCFFQRWTEEQRQQFAENCQREDISREEFAFSLLGFDRDEIRTIEVEQIRAGQVVDTFTVHPLFFPATIWVSPKKSYPSERHIVSRIEYLAQTDRPIMQRQDSLRFTISQQVFILSDFKKEMWPQFSMVSEGYGCRLTEFSVNGERREYHESVLVKTGYQDMVEEQIQNGIQDSEKWLLLKVERILQVVDAFFVEEKTCNCESHISTLLGNGLEILGDAYVTSDIDDTGMKLVLAEKENEKGNSQNSLRIRYEVLKERYALFQKKIKLGVPAI